MTTVAQKTHTIMIVDDSPSIRKVVGIALSGVGYTILEGTDGADALVQLEERKDVDLILCDVNMPNVDGMGFVKRLRAEGHHRFTPVVMLTTERCERFETEARAAGIRAWIQKPFDADNLLATVRRFLI